MTIENVAIAFFVNAYMPCVIRQNFMYEVASFNFAKMSMGHDHRLNGLKS